MHKNMDAPRGGDDAKRKKPVSKGCILDDSVYVTIKITNNIIVEMENRVMDQWLPGIRDWGVQGMKVGVKINIRESYYNGTVECPDCGGRYTSYMLCDRTAQNYTHTHTNEYMYNW